MSAALLIVRQKESILCNKLFGGRSRFYRQGRYFRGGFPVSQARKGWKLRPEGADCIVRKCTAGGVHSPAGAALNNCGSRGRQEPFCTAGTAHLGSSTDWGAGGLGGWAYRGDPRVVPEYSVPFGRGPPCCGAAAKHSRTTGSRPGWRGHGLSVRTSPENRVRSES